jgi:hypothetical protein
MTPFIPPVRYFVYRPESIYAEDIARLQKIDWEADATLSSLVWFAVALLGGTPGFRPTKPECYSLPLLAPVGRATSSWRAIILYSDGPTAVVSPIRLHAFRKYFSASITIRPSKATGHGDFSKRVGEQARRAVAHLRSFGGL